LKTFIIIGFGLTGNALFCRLINHLIESETSLDEIRIIIFEKNPAHFGTGFPYDTNSPAIWTLNNTSDDFKFVTGVETLADWIERNPNVWKEQFIGMDSKYVPRALVGQYLKAQYKIHKEKACEKGMTILEYFEEVQDIHSVNEDTWQIFGSNFREIADYIFLCFGHLPNYQYVHLWDKPQFFSWQANISRLQTIPVNTDVYILGFQAASVDMALWLAFVHKLEGKIHTVTRNRPVITTKGNADTCDTESLDELKLHLCQIPKNTLSFAEGKTLFMKAYKKVAKEPINLENHPSVTHTLEYQLAKYEQQQQRYTTGNVDEFRAFVKYFYFNGCYKTFWETLEDHQKTLFTRFMYSQIMAYLTGITPLNTRLLLELYERNMLVENPGIKDVQYDEKNKNFLLLFETGKEITADYVIDASGFSYQVNQCQVIFPLIRNLVTNGYLVPLKQGGISRTPCFQTINSQGEIQKNLFCIGPVASYGWNFPTSHASFQVFNDVNHIMEAFSQHSKLSLNPLG